MFIENHDHSRAVSRFGNDSEEWRAISAKMLAILQITQSGTQFVYQGQELGLKNFPRSWGIEEYKDIASQNFWNRLMSKFLPFLFLCHFDIFCAHTHTHTYTGYWNVGEMNVEMIGKWICLIFLMTFRRRLEIMHGCQCR